MKPRAGRLNGFTLIEMLIVVSIMMILVAVAATAFRPANDSRRVREAARAINVYLSSARNRAMETGRPCGVMLRRFAGAPTAVLNLDQCEVPPCYAGETESSVATVTATGTVVFYQNASLGTPEFLPDRMVRANDLIQFNCQGPTYYIVSKANGSVNSTTGFFNNDVSSLTVTLFDAIQAPTLPWPTGPSPPVSYRIYRSPVKGAATPLQLPATTVVDLGASGIDMAAQVFSAGNSDVIILFSPNGSIDRVYIGGVFSAVTQPIFLLVGKRERVGNEISPLVYDANNMATWANWRDLNNIWVVVNPQTGLVTTGEIAVGNDIPAARLLARDAQSMGGK